MAAISATAIAAASQMPEWIGSTMSAIKANENLGGILGALQNSKNPSANFANVANSFSLIAQNSVSDSSAFYAQLASQTLAKRQDDAAMKALKELNDAANMVKPKNMLDAVIYFEDGSTLDTTSNIMTMVSGKQYDVTTGAEYVDQSSIIQMGDGSYLNTVTNVLTMSDGTQIDTVTGLRVDQLLDEDP